MDLSNFIPEDSGRNWDLSKFEPEKPAAPRGIVGYAKDTGLDIAKGVVGLGESVVGLGDLATFGAIGKGLAKIGYDPKATSGFLSGLQSDARQESDREVSQADGFWGTLSALGSNPDTLIGNIVQSLPGTIGGGAVAGQLVKKIAGVAATEAAGLGLTGTKATEFISGKVKEQAFKIAAAAGAAEGAQTAGSIAEKARQSGSDWDQYVAPALAAGLGTAAIGMVSGKIGAKFGIGDAETDIATMAAGVRGAGQGKGGIISRGLKEVAKEGFLEEMPQSYQEQGFQNLATGKPWEEGTAAAAAQGLAAGMGMAGGHAIISGARSETKPPEVPPEAPPAPLQLGNTPDPFISFPDGTVGRRADVDNYVNGLPEEQRAAARAKLMGLAPQPAIADIGKAATADDAISAFQKSVSFLSLTGTDMAGLMGSENGIISAVREREADTAELQSLIDSETRDLQVMQANVKRDADKQREMDALQAQGRSVEAAATVEAPNAMQLALQRAREKAGANQAPTAAPMAPAIPEVAAPEVQPEPALSHPNMLPGDMARANGQPYQSENGARLKLSEIVKKGGTGEVIQLGDGAFVVRPKPQGNANGPETNQAQSKQTQQPAAPVDASPAQAGQTPQVQPAAGGVVATTDSAQPGDGALNPRGEVASPLEDKSALNADLGHLGKNNTPLSEGGKPFRTNKAAREAKKQQPMMRVVKVEGGYALAPKTEAQIAAQTAAARRLSVPRMGHPGIPAAAHEFIAGEGGIDPSHKSEFSMGNNPRVGNRRLFAGARGGLSLEDATQKLIEAGYLQEGASHSDTINLIGRSVTQPQYTPEGFEQMAQAEQDQQFEDHLAAQQEAAQNDDFDPFESLDDMGIAPDDLDTSGYDEANDPIKLIVNALVAQAKGMGLDVDHLKEQAYEDTRNGSEQDYLEAARDAIQSAIDASQGNRSEDSGQTSNAGSEEGLTSPTRADVLKQQADAEAEAKRKEDGGDKPLPRRELTGDVPDMFNTQGSVFDQPEAPAVVNPLDVPTDKETQSADAAVDALTDAEASAVLARMGKKPRPNHDVKDAIKQEHPDDIANAIAGKQWNGKAWEESKAKATVTKPGVESKSEPAAKIEDSGEVLEGARKLYAKAYAAKMDEGMALDVAAVPLSKSWPEPDYQRMLDDGADPWAVAFAHAARDEVPTKPSKAWKVKGWVEKVQLLRGFTNKVLTGDGVFERENVKSKLTGALADLAHKVDLYEAAGHARSLKGTTFSVGKYGMYAGKTFDPPKTMWAITEPSNSASATWSHGNWGNEIAVADTKAEAIEKYKAWAALQSDKPAAPTKGTVFDIYSYRSKPGEFIIGKRLTARRSIDLKSFPSAEEARDYKTKNQSELEALLEAAKVEPPERRENNAPRVGSDYRMGADVTTEQFRGTFGFRGEQFGASMPQAERQANLNQAYDALMDLAGVIGVPPKALSLNGELGLAFGARGTGGKNAPMAHYERDTTGAVTPNRVVINLTRKSGAGSLAHEWFHGVDNYFARLRGEQGGMLTDRPYELMNKGVRPEMIEAFKELMKTINLTGIKERSKQLDKKRVKDYWSTGLEMAARSFESYVIAKLQDQNASNDYLANVVPESLYGMQAAYPYPSMGEMPQIRAAFDHFFDTVQTKETDKGIALQEPQSAYNATRDLNEPTQPDDGKAGATESATVPTVRGDGSALQRRVAITGMGIAADIKRAGSAALIGRKVTNPAELAELAQIYRDPRYETFRVFFTKDNTVVHATGVSARMPGFTPMLPSDMTMQQYVTMFKDEMQRTGADGYYLLHNHPSGNPTPSSADISITAELNAKVPGMKAHVVINSNKYAVIEANASALISPESRVKVKDFGEDQMLKASKPMAAIGRALNKPDDLVAIGKSMQRPGWITLIGSDSQNRVRVVAETPSSTLTRSDAYLAGAIRRLMRNSGSTNVFAMGENGDINSKPIQRAVKIGLLRDAVPETGISLGAAGLAIGPSANYFNYTQGRAVAEDQADMQFSRGASIGMTVDQAKAITDPLTAKWNLDVKVVATPADLPIPAPSDVRGMYMGGKIWIVASNNANRAQILETLGHEAIAHHGLREMLGREDWRKLMTNINLAIKSGNKPLNAISQRVRSEYVDDNGKFNLSAVQEADEIAAKVVEGAIDPVTGEFNPGLGFMKSVFAKVAQFLRDLGIDVKFTNLELQGMLVASMRNMESGARMQGGGAQVVAANRGSSLDTALNAKAFFADTKYDSGIASKDVAMADAIEVMGFDPQISVLAERRLDMASTPMRYDLGQSAIMYNTAVARSRAADVQYMIEEVLHALDHVGNENTISASNPRFLSNGDIRLELEKSRIKSAAMSDILAHPLDEEYTDSVTAAELFARSGAVFFANPNLLRLTAPKTYELFKSAFGLPRSAGAVSGSIRGQTASTATQVSQSDGRRNTGLSASNAVGSAKRQAAGLQQLRKSVLQEFGGKPNGSKVDFSGNGSSLSTVSSLDLLTSYTPEEAKKKQLEEEAARKAEAEKPKAPTGRKVTADQVDLFNPQDSLFSRGTNDSMTNKDVVGKSLAIPADDTTKGANKAVDSNGKPVTVYHGTPRTFERFEAKHISSGMYGEGFYFTNLKDDAELYSQGGRVIPATLTITNPASRAVAEEVANRIGEDDYSGIRKELERMGYDGVIAKGNVGGEVIYVAFKPEQINQGGRSADDTSPGTVKQLQSQLEAIEAKYEPLRKQKSFGSAWDAIGVEAGIVRQKLFDLTGDYYGRPKVKVVRPSYDALNAEYLSPEDVPQDVRVWVQKNAGTLTSDATDAVRWGRITDTLKDDRYPSGDLTIYRAVANGDQIRAGDWVTTERKYAEMHLSKYLNGKGEILEETVNGRDVLASPTGNSEEAIYAPRILSGPVANEPTAPDSGGAPMFSRSLITGQPLPQTWQAPDASKLDDVIYSMQDKHVDTKRVVKSVRDAIGGIADNLDPYLQEELYHGRAAMATKEFLEKQVRPLLTDMQARGVEMSDFEEYLHNRHAERRNVQVAKVNPAMQDGGSGIQTADARAYLSGLPADKARAYKALAVRVDQINRDTRALLVSSGLEKQTTIDAWDAAYGDEYVPLMREEMDNGSMGIGQGFSVRGAASKRAMGSNKPVANIMANIALQREKAITRSEKRKIGEALYGMVLSAPNSDFWFAIDPALQQNPSQITATAMQLISMGMNPADAQSIAKEPKERYIDPRTGQVAERINPALRSSDNVLSVRIDGEDKYVFFNAQDPRAMRMAQALKNLDSDQLGVVMGSVAKMTRYFSAINTQYNPIFGVVNITRDVQTALLNLASTPLASHKADVMKHILPALRGIYIDLRDHRQGKQPTSSYAQIFEEFQREGGATGYRDMYANAQERADAIKDELADIKSGKAKQLGKGIMGWLSDYNESMENAVRVAAYKVGKEQGMTNQQAASLAKNLTVNFNRKGQVALQAGALYAFFNASVQGTARIAQTMFEGGKLSGVGKKILTGGLLLGSMQALMLAAAGFDDEEPPDFVRERSLVIPIGDKKYVSIPMPLGFHVIPNLARIPTEWAMGGFKNTPKRIGQMIGLFADAFNPIGSAGLSLQTLTPTIIDPLAALAENKDFTGKSIARQDFDPLHPTAGHTRAKNTATPWAKFISQAVNYATGGTDYKPGLSSPTPDQIDYLIGQVTGGVGREVGKLSQVAGGVSSGEDVPLYKIPLVGRFVGTTEGQAAEAGRFYENLKSIGEHKVELDGLRKDRKASEAAEYLRDNPEAVLVQMANKTQQDVSKLNKLKRELLKNDGSRERVKLIDMQITSLMKRLNDRVRAMREREAA